MNFDDEYKYTYEECVSCRHVSFSWTREVCVKCGSGETLWSHE